MIIAGVDITHSHIPLRIPPLYTPLYMPYV